MSEDKHREECGCEYCVTLRALSSYVGDFLISRLQRVDPRDEEYLMNPHPDRGIQEARNLETLQVVALVSQILSIPVSHASWNGLDPRAVSGLIQEALQRSVDDASRRKDAVDDWLRVGRMSIKKTDVQ